MKYFGQRGQRTETGGQPVCFVDDRGIKTPLDPRNDLVNHSPNGFEWGYGGSGPAQLALAICSDALRRSGLHPAAADERARRVYQFFKQDVLQTEKEDIFEYNFEMVLRVIEKIEEERGLN